MGEGPVAAERDATSEQVVSVEEQSASGEWSVAAEPDMGSERAVTVEQAVENERNAAREWATAAEQAAANKAPSMAVRFVDYNESTQVLAFPCAWLPDARKAFPSVDFIESLNVVELDDSGMPVVREVDARIAL